MQNSSSSPAFRTVTTGEAAHFRDHGWVQLKRFIPPATVGKLLAMARERMGPHGTASEGLPHKAAALRRRNGNRYTRTQGLYLPPMAQRLPPLKKGAATAQRSRGICCCCCGRGVTVASAAPPQACASARTRGRRARGRLGQAWRKIRHTTSPNCRGSEPVS